MIEVLVESKQVNPFEMSTHTPFYDSLLSDKPASKGSNYTTAEYYKFEKGIEGHIEYMTAEEYLKYCDKVFGSRSGTMSGVNQSKAKKYAEDMLSGSKFPLPYVYLGDEYGDSQEGRHRMIAISIAYGEDAEAPVLVANDSSPSDDEIMDYAKKKFPDDPQWAFNYVSSRFRRQDASDKDDSEVDDSSGTIEFAVDCEVGDIISVGEDDKCKIVDSEVKLHSIVFVCVTEDGNELMYEFDDNDLVLKYKES